MKRGVVFAAAVGLTVSALVHSSLRAQALRSVWDGVYTEQQARRGAALYDQECSSCHGPAALGGGMAGALTGPIFTANYDTLTVGDLFERNRTTMPVGKEGQLSRQQIADITAYILECNKFPAGTEELPTQSMLLTGIAYLAIKP